MRLSGLILLLATLIPGTLLADQAAFVIREAAAYKKPNSGAAIHFNIRAGKAVDVLTRKGGWKQVRVSENQQVGWVRSYLVRENEQYRDINVVQSKQESGGFFSGLASLSRKVSGFFATPSASTNEAVATIGIRGRSASSSSEDGPPMYWLSPKRIIESEGNQEQLSLLQTFSSSRKAARKFAAEGGLKANSLPLLGGH